MSINALIKELKELSQFQDVHVPGRTNYIVTNMAAGHYGGRDSIETANVIALHRLTEELPGTFIHQRFGTFYLCVDLDVIGDDSEALDDIANACNSFAEYPVIDEDTLTQVEDNWWAEETEFLASYLKHGNTIWDNDDLDIHHEIFDQFWDPGEGYLDTTAVIELLTKNGYTKTEEEN